MQHPTFLEELMAAGRGVFALFVGDRKAAGFFDTTQRGLVTSFIALVLAAAIYVFLPLLISKDHDSAIVSLVQYAVLFAAQLGGTVLVLRQFKRMDALVPYLVADNWVAFFVTLIFAVLVASGITGDPAGAGGLALVFDIAELVLEIRLARIIMGLAPLQVAALIIAQLVAGFVVLGATWLIFGVPPDIAAQLNSLGQ